MESSSRILIRKRCNRIVRCLSSIYVLTVLSYGVCTAQTSNFDISGHTKYRMTSTMFPNDGFFRSRIGSSGEDLGFDARLSANLGADKWDLQVDAQFGAFYGDIIELSRDFDNELQILFPRLPSDDQRLFDLTKIITDDDKQATLGRLDRFSAGYTGDNGVLRFGRQAVTWGNGLVFNNVMDIFNPFDPTAIDKEYKSGDDMLYGQYLRNSGDDLQAVVVLHRGSLTRNVEADQSSFAAKYHGFLGVGEYDFVVARHFGENLVGLGGNYGIGGALWRGDLMVTFTDNEGSIVSAVTSLSHSFSWIGKNVSAVIEYYFNGFGQRGNRYSTIDLTSNPNLLERLARGEIFNLGRHYIGLSTLIEITPLFLLTPNLFLNIEDDSALVQITTQTDLNESMLLLGALNIPVGRSGTEYGGIDLGVPGSQLSTGPGVFVQLAWYF